MTTKEDWVIVYCARCGVEVGAFRHVGGAALLQLLCLKCYNEGKYKPVILDG